MSRRSRSLNLFIRRVIKHCSNYRHINFFNYIQNTIQNCAFKVNSIGRGYYRESTVWISEQQDTTDHVFCMSVTLEKKREYNEAVHQLFIDFKKPMIRLGG